MRENSKMTENRSYQIMDNTFLILRILFQIIPNSKFQTAAARVRRATINEGVFYVDTVVDSRYLEMDVVRERKGSLNGSEVESGAKKV